MKFLTETPLLPPKEETGMFAPMESHVEVVDIDTYEELEESLYLVGDIVKVVDGEEIGAKILDRPDGKLFKFYHGDESISYRIFKLTELSTNVP